MKNLAILLLTAVLGSGLASCTKQKFKNASSSPSHAPGSKDGNDPAANKTPDDPKEEGMLVWKRYRAFEKGLMAGLELSKDELCQEIETFNCIDKVHLTVLGGNDPFENGQHERAERPSVLTAVAVSRVLMAACSQRADLDLQAGSAGASVFKHFDLGAAAPTDAQIQAQATELFQRLLARDPSTEELSAIVDAKGNFASNRGLAVGICYAVGTHVENIFI